MKWKDRLRVITRKDETSRDLDDELQFHIDKQIEANLAEGMPPAEARRAALLEFGAVEGLKEECRSARGMDWLENLFQDLRYAARNFRRRPGFALAVIAIMAAGIGSATAVFSFVDRVLFRDLPYADTSRLVSIGTRIPWLEYDFLTGYSYVRLRREPGPLAAVTSTAGLADCDLMDNEPVRVQCGRVESTFLPVLGVEPVLGRNFTVEEDQPNVPRVGLISHSLWQTRFGGQKDAIGRRLTVDSQQVQIIGVLPPDFEMPTLDRADLLVPQGLPASPAPASRPLRVFGRMRPEASTAQVSTALHARADDLLGDFPPPARQKLQFHVRSLRDLQTGDFQAASWTLLAAVLSMLLIACANAANLFMARAAASRREIAIRVALGAGRARMIRQALTESMLLSLFGGVGGALVAYTLLRWFVLIAPGGIPHLATASLDLRVLVFSFALSVLCGIVFGLAPALSTPKPQMLTGTRTTWSANVAARRILVGAQLAVSLVLLTCAGTLLQSLWKRQALSLGMSPEGVVTAQFTLGQRYGQPAARSAFYSQLEERLAKLPGVEAIALSDSLPPGGTPRSQPLFAPRVEGKPPLEEGPGGIVVWRAITPGYFAALGIPIVRGRPFTEEDRRPESRSIIISAAYARRLFGDENPLGHRMARGPADERNPQVWYTIVGVSADARNGGLADQTNPEYYLARRRGTTTNEDAPAASAIILRSRAPKAALEAWLRTEVSAIDRAVPVIIRRMEEHVGSMATRPRFQASLLMLFAGTGLFLAAFGLYGLVSFLVTQREREFGVRLTLGATPAEIIRMILKETFRWTSGGLAVGLAGSVIAAYSLRSLLFHVSPADPRAYAAAVLALTALALFSAFLPSRRAAHLDPAVTLRQD